MRVSRLPAGLLALVLAALSSLWLVAPPAQAGPAVATRLEVTRTPPKQLVDRRVRVDATLLTADEGTPVADEEVVLQRRFVGADGWTELDSDQTAADGTVVFLTRARRNAEYRAVYTGSSDPLAPYEASTSAPVLLKVFRHLPTDSERVRGPVFRLFGSVEPRYAGQPVVLQRKGCPECRWREADRKDTTSESTWSFRVRAGDDVGDVVSYRAFTPRTEQFLRSFSSITLELSTVPARPVQASTAR